MILLIWGLQIGKTNQGGKKSEEWLSLGKDQELTGKNMKAVSGEFPGNPVVKTPHFSCREHGFNPWSGREDPVCCMAGPKKSFWCDGDIFYLVWSCNISCAGICL